MDMKKIDFKGLLIRVFVPTTIIIILYLVLGHFCKIPHLLLFCILSIIILLPIELGTILFASKKEFGTYSLKSAMFGQEKMSVWKILIISFCFFGMAGVFAVVVSPIEHNIFADVRATVLNNLPAGFDWTNYEYLKSFPKSMIVLTCVVYGIFNVFLGTITEELYFRGYLTSHYCKQGTFTPILITILFSLYHLWLPFDNVFRILVFSPVAYVSYKKKNIYINLCFHFMCNLLSTVNFVLSVLG